MKEIFNLFNTYIYQKIFNNYMLNKRTRYYRPEISSLNIPGKANRILNILLVSLILILFRIWYLSVVKYDEKLEESRKPQRKTVMESSKRGTIRDRFNVPLAINKIQYQAGIVYSELLQIPAVVWEKNKEGDKPVKRFKRKEYITALSELLATELKMDAQRVEDLIYSKSSFYHQFPFIIKEEVSENCYYRLKMLEKDWLGIHVRCVPKRYYPKNHVASDIIGFMGAINKQEHEKIIREIKNLNNYLSEHEKGEDEEYPEGITSYDHAITRLKELEAHAYTINDYVGKIGIEGFFEDNLRGYQGKKSFYSDSRGNFLRELPGKTKPLSGERILLTVSAELQEYAEELLAKNERIRIAHFSNKPKQTLLSLRQPWIKGGAIVVLDPNNGDVIAMASYPRFNPNDFIASGIQELNKKKRSNINRWFESESYIAEIWDQKRSLERERFDDRSKTFFEDERLMDLKTYLDFILPETNEAYQQFSKLKNLKEAINIQQFAEKLISFSGQDNAYFALNALYKKDEHVPYKNTANNEIKCAIEKSFAIHEMQYLDVQKELDPYFSEIKNNYDKVLFLDLCRILVPANLFDEDLKEAVKTTTLSDYRNTSAAMISVVDIVRQMSKELFHQHSFVLWRKEFEKPFLKQKRLWEKVSKKHQRPYIEYFDIQEAEMFKAFWEENHVGLITAFLTGRRIKDSDNLKPYTDHFINWYKELEADAEIPLEWKSPYNILKNAVKSYETPVIIRYLSTLRSYHDLNRSLLGSYRYLRKNTDGKQLEKHLAAAFYPKNGFGYGRSQAFRQSTTQGSIFKLVTAYETLSQRYNKLDKKNLTFKNLNPLDLVDVTHYHGKEISLGFFEDGTPIPRVYKGGRLLKSSRAGIGQIDLIKAIETSSNPYFSILAGDALESPEDLANSAKQFSFGSKTGIDLIAELSGKVPEDIKYNKAGLYAMAIGQHSLVVTPLQTSVFLSSIANGGKIFKPNIVKMKVANDLKTNQNIVSETPISLKRTLFMPDVIKGMLLEGMRLVVQKQIKSNLSSLSRLFKDYPEAITDYVKIKDQFVGKTSTSESTENLNLDLDYGTNLYTHVWFGGIAFNSDMQGLTHNAIVFKDNEGKPELVVIIYLKYGTHGWAAAPLAAQMVQKWREIKQKHEGHHFIPK
jgi:cell division protein FtsI/penicillin-binding protein 2